MDFSISIKQQGSSKYRQLTSAVKIDFCAMAEDANSVKNIFVRAVMKQFQSVNPMFSTKCPIEGQFTCNTTYSKSVLGMMPNGVYASKIGVYDSKPSVFLNFTMKIKQN